MRQANREQMLPYLLTGKLNRQKATVGLRLTIVETSSLILALRDALYAFVSWVTTTLRIEWVQNDGFTKLLITVSYCSNVLTFTSLLLLLFRKDYDIWVMSWWMHYELWIGRISMRADKQRLGSQCWMQSWIISACLACGLYLLCNAATLSLSRLKLLLWKWISSEFIFDTQLLIICATIGVCYKLRFSILFMTKLRQYSSVCFSKLSILNKFNSLSYESIGFYNWQMPLLTICLVTLLSLSLSNSASNFYSAQLSPSSQSSCLCYYPFNSIPSITLAITLGPIRQNSIYFQICTYPLLKPTLTAEMKNYFASFHPLQRVPKMQLVSSFPNRPALFAACSNTSIIYSYSSILNLRLIAMPDKIALMYGSQTAESASYMNLRKDSLWRRIPNSRGVSMFV